MELTNLQKQMMLGKVCPYCKQPSQYVDSKIIYGTSYGMVYYCEPCKAWCGVHTGTTTSKGRLANAELREAKKQAHFYFDKIWKLKIMTRTEAYEWLSRHIGTTKQYTHIGMFSIKSCKETIYFSKQLLNDMRRLDLDMGAEPPTPYYPLD